ncbi:peptide-methionine (S)-S-oxide reductase MsrA [Luteolibacter algae]|uniref:Peptide methionine sulfoxide reductase MsrA n=2 Tax=Luteolibacter algae TaxID=454151 RepID=A0ABW5D548_9BACT
MDISQKLPAELSSVPEGAEIAILGAGCFWCIEAALGQIDGIDSVISGYMGGSRENPSYEDICTGSSGHAEVVRVVFDPAKIDFERILAWFWDLHDPTQLNRQGNDVGTQYRSVIFYTNALQKDIAEASKEAAQKHFDRPIVTEISPAETFYPAERYHQGYYFENKSRNGYCQFVVEPKLKKLNLKH